MFSLSNEAAQHKNHPSAYGSATATPPTLEYDPFLDICWMTFFLSNEAIQHNAHTTTYGSATVTPPTLEYSPP
ncbi:unnamed protein product, partial [Iphiclides podalirius]